MISTNNGQTNDEDSHEKTQVNLAVAQAIYIITTLSTTLNMFNLHARVVYAHASLLVEGQGQLWLVCN
jgi:hypothetical protein